MDSRQNTQYQSTRHAKFRLAYHFIWCPKYRRGILDDAEVAQLVRQTIQEVVDSLDCQIIALEIMPDHVHLAISAIPQYSPGELAGKIKGATGSRIAARFPHLKRRGKIWSRSYFCATIGSVSAETVKNYIETQWSRIE
jgi:putative transposase